jgi:RHS repeat-associated protein
MNNLYVFNQTGMQGIGSSWDRGQAIKPGLKKLAVMIVVLFCALTTSAQYTYTYSSGSVDDASGSGHNYANYVNESYLIQPPGAISIELYFYSFSTEANYDFVYVYDGADERAPLIGRYHNGNLPPYCITSTGGSLFIRFTTNSGITYEGFSFYYQAEIQHPTFNEYYTNLSGTFDDSSGSALYPGYFTGTYLIQPAGASTVTLSFLSFNTEANYDYVYVYNGPDTSAPLIGAYHNGNLPPASITSSGGSLFIRFTTDGYGNYDGWTAQYTGNRGGVTRSLTLANNYIYSITPQVEKSDLSQAAASDLNEEVVYIDGLGRPMQAINIQASPNGQDIVTPITYDKFGRESTKYLPYATTTAGNGTFKSAAIDVNYTTNCDHYKFYNTETNSVVNDTKPFSWTDFEASPLNRVLRQGAPGATWQPGTDPASDHSVKYSYQTNTANEVILWKVSADALVNGGYYPTSSLYKTTSWDENNQLSSSTSRSEEFKDLQGNVVLKRSFNGTEVLSTYYVYDDLDLLRFVLTPKAMENTTVDQGVLDALCYQYRYDGRKRMIVKKLPGADPVYMVYDKRDRLVATQDGVQRLKSPDEWTFIKYDALNRPIMTGIYKVADGTTQATLQALVNGQSVYSEDRLATGYGYTNNSFPQKTGLSAIDIAEADILTLTYYDMYGFPGAFSFDNSSVNISGYNEGTIYEGTSALYFEKLKGQVTGTKTRVLETNLFLTSTNYYDDRYRMIQSRRSLYDGGVSSVETLSSLYDFTGKVKQARQAQTFNGVINTVDKFYSYDQAGRLSTTKQQITGDTQNVMVTLAENSYNEIGQLIDKKLHKTTSGTYLQSVDYTYNIRGWLTGINNPDNLSALQPGDTNLDLYGQRLQYETAESGLTTSTQFNGNISAMVWNTSGKSKQGYGFTYDGLSRLKESDHKDFGTYWADNTKYEEKSITYDLNGNIKNLVRTDAAGGTMASYTYTYSGNQLASVGIGSAYVYDKNGNATTDGLRAMQVSYNLLNLPKTVSKGSDNIAYIYSAAGEKLAKKKKDNMYQYYAGSMVYNNNKLLDYLIFDEGLVYKTSTLYAYEYHLKDHLGNVRVTFQPNGTTTTVKQVTEYYPFGMNYAQSPGGTNKYLYNGKEKQDDVLSLTALDLYDYGARFYDPMLGRWSVIDGKAEKYLSFSPYIYAANNPIRFLDPDGNKIVDANGNEIYTQKDGWAKNASVGAQRIGNAMMLTQAGNEMFNKLVNTSYDVTLTLSSNEGPNGNLGAMTPTYDKDGNIVKADIVVFEKSIKNDVKKFSDIKKVLENNPNASVETTEEGHALLDNMPTSEERIGQVGVHEGEHATNKQAQEKFNPDKKSREALANMKEMEAIKQEPAYRLKEMQPLSGKISTTK